MLNRPWGGGSPEGDHTLVATWPEIWVYLLHILFAMAVIAPAAIYQAIHYYGGFSPRFFLTPLLVSTGIGLLLGRSALLKRRLRVKGEQFRAIADLAQEFTYYRRIDGHYEYVSPSCESLTGYCAEEFYATPNLMDQLIHEADRGRWHRHVHAINDNGEAESLDLRLVAKSGREVWFNHLCAPVCDARGRQIGVRSTNLDITGRKHDQERIERMAYYDPLTELPNRRSLQRHLRQLICRCAEEKERFAVLFLDLNRFKNINDSFGHPFGDRLLRLIAQRIQAACADHCLVSRFGGDEFVVVLDHYEGKGAVAEFAKGLLMRIEQQLEIDEVELFVSASVGITFFPDDGDDADTLIRNADVAMYKTKRDGSGQVRVYSTVDSDEAARFVTTENKIHKALQNREFIVHYQPKVDMRSGRIQTLEALARWNHPAQGLISPGDFIPVAEETGQINELGKQVLQMVLQDLARWQEMGIAVPVAFNVSARQFADPELANKIVAMIAAQGCAVTLLEMEITEQVFLGDIDTACERLRQIRQAGLRIALDDFGTGYSSMSYLRQLPIDTIKIDRSFICNIETDRTENAIIRSIVGLCRDLGLGMVVEGIETRGQAEALLALGCSQGQGYYYHHPMSAAALEAALFRQREGGQRVPGTEFA